MRILFITSSRIGDAILSTGVLSHLLDSHPEARMTVVCGPLAAPLFEAIPRLERIIPVTKKRFSAHWLDIWKACMSRRWDVVVDLRGSAVSTFLMAGKRYVKRGDLGGGHVVEQLARLLDLDEPPDPRIWTAPEHWQEAEELLPAGPPTIAVAPVANWRGKQWRVANFVELVRRLTAADGILPDARIVVLGAEEDRTQAQAMVASISPGLRHDFVGRVGLLTAFHCLRHCHFYIGNDSGTTHLAAAAGVPTLALFGPSREEHYRPWGCWTAVVRTTLDYDELVGGPRYDHRTTGTLMDSLSVDMAEDGALELWRRYIAEAA